MQKKSPLLRIWELGKIGGIAFGEILKQPAAAQNSLTLHMTSY